MRNLVTYVLLITFSGLLLFRCTSPDRTQVQLAPSRPYSVAEDTLLRNDIQKVVAEINAKLNQGEHGYLPLAQEHGKTDSIEYWIIDGRPSRISLQLDSPEKMVWPTYFLKDGKIIMVRYRNWSKTPPTPYGEELMVYYKDGQAFYCDERRMDLPNNMPPANIRTLPYTLSPRPLAQIESYYTTYWNQITSALSGAGIKL